MVQQNQKVKPSGRDTKGRFVGGNRISPGRKVGSRVKLAHDFVTTLQNKFNKYGGKAIEKVATEQPAQFLKIVADVLPREFLTRVEVDARLEVSGEVKGFVEAYRLAKQVIGADVIEAEVIEADDAQE
jgi:hypothetical protein